jgi:hypothetical protein
MSIEKIPVMEARKFLNNFKNKTDYPKLHEMIFYYMDLRDKGQSQYIISSRGARI